jgi:Ca-activated chloride channel homolog
MFFRKRWNSFLAMSVLAVFLCSLPAQSQKPEQAGSRTIKVQVDMVSLPVVVTTAGGKRVSNLKQGDFQVFEDNIRQKIAGFAAANEPFWVAFMLDTSGSTAQELKQIQREAFRFTRFLPRQDSVAVFSFGEDVLLLQNFTTDRERLASAIEKISPRGLTALYEAVWRGIQEAQNHRPERCALVLFTDGLDTASKQVTRVKTRELAKECRTPIYAVHFNTHEDPSGRQYLMELAENSGGKLLEPAKVGELSPAFKAIARELTNQYSIGYYPTNSNHDGKFRKVEVKVNRSGLAVQTRKGYWAPDDTVKVPW